MRFLTIALFLPLLTLMLLFFASCQGSESKKGTAEHQEQMSSPISPLSGKSPLLSNNGKLFLPTDVSKTSKPQLLFYSSRNDKLGWYLYDLESRKISEFRITSPQFRLNSLSWVSDLGVFLAQLIDTQGSSDLYLVDMAGNLVTQITHDPYDEGDADFSKDRNQFVYTCLQQDLDICIIGLHDSEKKNLTNSNSRDANPKWSPESDKILFISNASGITNVWVMNPDGSERQNLSKVALGNQLFEEGEASWSPDGQEILFSSMVNGNTDIYIMQRDGTGRHNLTDHPATDFNPVWSPDGQSIAFLSDRDGGYDIYVLELATGKLTNVSNSPRERENNFIWSPDSQYIYFDSLRPEGVFDIFMVNRNGSNKRNLTNDLSSNDVDPQWVE